MHKVFRSAQLNRARLSGYPPGEGQVEVMAAQKGSSWYVSPPLVPSFW